MTDTLLDAFSPDELLDAVCPEYDAEQLEQDRKRRLAAQPIGALGQWREETRAGLKPMGALAHAACLEIAGLEARAAGMPGVAGDHFLRAAAVIVEAVAGKVAA